MAEIEGEGWPKMAGYSAHTNGPGSIDDKEYPHPASFMRNLSPTSCLFSIGSAVLHKNSKKTQPVNLEDIPITCGTPNHTCPFVDADLLGKARRAEYVRRAAYDTRVELARREEHDRRMEYALNLAFGQPRNASTIEDYEVQACRLEQMGKLIENLTTMITKSSRHEAATAEAIETTLVSSSSQQVLAIEDTAGGSYEDCEDWSLHMTDEEGKALSVLIRMQEPGEFNSQEVLARKVRRIPRPDMDPQREVKAGLGFDRAPEVELEKRQFFKICRRGTAQYGKDPGSHRAQEVEFKARTILKICRKTAEEGLVGTLQADALAYAPRELTRGAEGKEAGLQEQRQSKQVRTLTRVLRTIDPKLRTKIKYNNNGGKTEGDIERGVMSLKIYMYSTRRERMKLSTLVTKRASKKGQDIRSRTRRMKDKNKEKDWWKTLTNSNRNWKRKSLKGSTDVYLLKRTIELEID